MFEPRSALSAILSLSAQHQKMADRSKGIAVRKSWTECETLRNRQHPKRHPYPSASHGTFVCPRNAIRFQAGALAKTLAGPYSGVSYIHHTKYHDASVLWERAGHSEGMLITSNQKAFFSCYSSFLNIRNVVYRFFKNSLSPERGHQCFA